MTHFDNQNPKVYDWVMTDKFLTLKEVARVLRVSERSIFRYIDAGKLKATKIGYWRIAEADLKKFVAGGEKKLKPKKKLHK